MKCYEFEDNLTEYVAGRLSGALASRMMAHGALCTACANKEKEERKLRGLFRSFAPVQEQRDLWPRLQSQLQPHPRRTPFRWPWAYGGTAMAFAACAALLLMQVSRPLPPQGTINVPSAFISVTEEQKVTRMVSDNRRLRTVDSEALFANLQSSNEEERAVLLGGSR